MIAEAIQKIIDIAKPSTEVIDGKLYSNKPMELIDTAKNYVLELKVSGLPGLVELVKSEAILYASSDDPLFVEIVDPCYVRVFGSLDGDLNRTAWYSAKADVPGFRSGYRTYEEFVIELRSRFVPNEGTEYLLDLFSRMDINEKSTSEDNGITQQVTVRQGISLKDMETVRPIVKLIPYRTFFEAAQPESEFLVRVDREGSIGIFEADGGMWKRTAKEYVFAWLASALLDETTDGSVKLLY